MPTATTAPKLTRGDRKHYRDSLKFWRQQLAFANSQIAWFFKRRHTWDAANGGRAWCVRQVRYFIRHRTDSLENIARYTLRLFGE
jgi:hypothetical protein